MEDFNPDAYLKEDKSSGGFNPDSYLSGATEKKNSLSENTSAKNATTTSVSETVPEPSTKNGGEGSWWDKAKGFVEKIGENIQSGHGIFGATEAELAAEKKRGDVQFQKDELIRGEKAVGQVALKEKFGNALSHKNELSNKAQEHGDVISIVDYYPFSKEVNDISKQLKELGEPKTNEQKIKHNELVDRYNAIRSKPIDEYEKPEQGSSISIPDQQGNMQNIELVKDMGAYRKQLRTSTPQLKNTKTVGDLLDAQGKSIDQYNQIIPMLKQADADVKTVVGDYRKKTGYTDGEMGFWESFGNAASNTLNAAGDYILPEEQQAKVWKDRMLEEQIAPKQASGLIGNLGELGGGLTPYIVAGALTGSIGGWTGLGATALTQGALGGTSAGGTTGYEIFKEELANGTPEPEALKKAHKLANFNAVTSGLAFGSLSLLGGEGLTKGITESVTKQFGGQVAKKSATDAVLKSVKGMGLTAAIFGVDKTMNNLYANYNGIHRDWDEGVAENMMFPVALHLSMAAVTGGAKLTGKVGKEAYDTYTTFIAQNNPQSLQTIVDNAVKSGLIDNAHGQKVMADVQAKAEVISKMPPMPFDKLQEGIPAMQNWQKAKTQLEQAKKDGSPFLAQAEALEKEASRKVKETLGTPLSPKEQTAHEDLNLRKTESEKNKEAQGLTPLEKEELNHYNDRATHSDRVENIPQSKPFRVKSNDGQSGLLIKNEDGDMEFIPDGNAKGKVFERNEATPKKTIQEMGFTRVGEEVIQKPTAQILSGEVKQGEPVLFGGKRYTLGKVVVDENGKIVKIKLDHKNGEKRTISDKSPEGKKLIDDANKLIGKKEKEEKKFTREKHPGEIGETETFDANGKKVEPTISEKETVAETKVEPNIFEKIEEAKRSKKSAKEKQNAAREAVKDMGELGEKAIFVDENFNDIKQKLSDLIKQGTITNLKIEC